MLVVECGQLLERVVTDDVRVENEEGRVIFAENLFGELERTRRAERFSLDGKFNFDAVVFLILMLPTV